MNRRHEIRTPSRRLAALAAAALLAVLSAPSPAGADATATAPALTLPMAGRVVEAAIAEARRLGAPGGAVAVVDAGGQPVAVARLDGSFPVSGVVALGKARTAALFARPTKVLESAINGGRTSMLALTDTVDATTMQGGVPLTIDGRVVGAVGVAGAASADQDSQIAEAAAPAVADPAALGRAELTHFAAADVVAAFAAGKPLSENVGFKVHASRREKAGEAEVHTLDTDVMYVLEGEAVLVLGGTVVEPRTVTPTEIRGNSIEGGEVHPLRKGDVLVIPAGTPHWFRDVVAGPVLYYTVKSTGAAR
ncbi:MAG TPA: heme-binding protein [Thermoanaerobaculia bacterium]|jgi:glc operon protein GlcG